MAKSKITFSLSAEIVGDAVSGILIGEFNNWDLDKGIKLKKSKDGSLNTQVELEAGKTYQYRYYLNDGRWVNDSVADAYVTIDEFAIENCIVEVKKDNKTVDAKKKTETKKKAETKTETKKVASKKNTEAKTETKKATTKKSSSENDLTKIEGIGKKIAELLNKDGIITFSDLANSSVASLQSILAAGGNRFKMHNPGTWPQQAKLAAEGKWDELKNLQDKLDGGK